MKIKVKLLNNGKMPLVSEKGDLFDVYAAEDITMNAPKNVRIISSDGTNRRPSALRFDNAYIRLGFAMELPKGFKANLYPRSSTFKNYGIIFANHVGQIDSSYCGDTDEWMISAISLRDTVIHKGDRIAQFEVVPSSKATIWQKIKWFFTNKIEFVEVDHLDNPTRGGFGSTGTK